MAYKNLLIIVIIVMLLFVIGIHRAEKGLYDIMGLDINPRSFYFSLCDKDVFSFTILGKSLKIRRYYKIGEVYTDRGLISLKINGKEISISSLIPADVLQKSRPNLDKKTSNMYN